MGVALARRAEPVAEHVGTLDGEDAADRRRRRRGDLEREPPGGAGRAAQRGAAGAGGLQLGGVAPGRDDGLPGAERGAAGAAQAERDRDRGAAAGRRERDAGARRADRAVEPPGELHRRSRLHGGGRDGEPRRPQTGRGGGAAALDERGPDLRRRRRTAALGEGGSGDGGQREAGHQRDEPAVHAPEIRRSRAFLPTAGKDHAASMRPISCVAPGFESMSLRLPHLGDCTHDGQPFSHGHSLIRRCASSTSASNAR